VAGAALVRRKKPAIRAARDKAQRDEAIEARLIGQTRWPAAFAGQDYAVQGRPAAGFEIRFTPHGAKIGQRLAPRKPCLDARHSAGSAP
jgi:hypothetical protein